MARTDVNPRHTHDYKHKNNYLSQELKKKGGHNE